MARIEPLWLIVDGRVLFGLDAAHAHLQCLADCIAGPAAPVIAADHHEEGVSTPA